MELRGKIVAQKIDEETLQKVNSFRTQNVFPTLATIRVGNKDDDIAYERNIIKKAANLNININSHVLNEDVKKEEFYELLDELNENPLIHGILLFRPLDAYLDDNKARNYIKVSKDIDGTSDESLGALFTNSFIGHAPCTAEAVIKILEYYDINVSGKNVLVIGRSLVIGKPLSMLLLNKNATVTIAHSHSNNLQELSREADIVVAAVGKKEMLDKDYFSEGQTVIDVGIHFDEIKNKLVGDVSYNDASSIVQNITPVPGGVGSVTTSILFAHLVDAINK